MRPVGELWVYLAANPLLHLTLTLIAYLIGDRIYRRFGMNPLLNPVVIAIVILVGLLVATGTSYERYFEGAQFVHFLLGPATVALAIPLYNQFERVRKSAGPLLAAVVLGSLAASLSAVAIAAPSRRSRSSKAPHRGRRPTVRIPATSAPGSVRVRSMIPSACCGRMNSLKIVERR